MYNIRSLGRGQFSFQGRGEAPFRHVSKSRDDKWFEDFFFVRKDSIQPPADYIFKKWVITSSPCDLTRIGAKIPTCSKLFCISESERKFPDLLLGFSPATSSNPLQSAHSMSSGSKVDPLEVILQSAKIKRSTASPDEASAFKRSAPAASFQTPPTQSSSDRPEPLEVDPLSRYPPTPPASPRASASGGTIAHVPEGFGNVYKVSYWPEIDRLLFPPLKEVFSEFSPEDMAENDVHNAFMVIQLAKGNLGRNKAHEEVSKEERGGKGGGRPRADQPAAGQPAGCHIGHV
ncbi:uncharacterized protein LOC141596422 isoform X3 [Silene latifolia]|uniref:uncharacterized protein LOC141596422 isoform X3 n=1 Tax=Silene latifolia TaxID=37657 RepID=UPI003D77877D